ncbi:hypothetical protein GGR54DRAFT_593813 [Hypoxylon sp. NC1633]|nr:hypothetical protein GGR54DRAFT_593813 [Hypoxylon sp. NC1633]
MALLIDTKGDTCSRKKIKCDMLKPACSNCLLYEVPCSTTTIRRRTAQPPRKEPYLAGSTVDDDSLQARLVRIEAKLDRLGDHNFAVTMADQRSTTFSIEYPQGPLGLEAFSSLGDRNIPSLTEILPVVADYFRDFNLAWPLFHQHSFMQMLYDFYSEQEQTKKSGAVWAAINVVLAIGYRIRTVETDDVTIRFNDGKVKKYINNAQKELDELVTREEDTLGIQVLLGLVILFQTGADQKPASVLIGTAVRLAHRLQLHVKSSLVSYPPDIARHRSNIFWLCYSLDKDMSLRARIPSVQNDEDIDLDLPGIERGDDESYLQSIDGSSQLNFLRARVQLGYLEGRVYDYLFSNRSTKLSQEARHAKVAYISGLLDQWLQLIPAPLRLENIVTTLDKAPLTHMIILYQTYLLCSTMVNGLYSPDAPWMKSIGHSGSAVFRTFDNQSHVCGKNQHLLLPDAWATCVRASRGCLEVLVHGCYGVHNPWLSGCAYFSAFVVLLANIIYSPSHELVDHDRRLTTNTMEQMEKLLDYTGPEAVDKLHAALVTLDQAASYAVEQAGKLAGAPPESTHSINQPQHHPYPPTQFEGFIHDFNQNLVPPPEEITSGSAWHHTSTSDASDINHAEFDYGDEIPTPSFMQGFSNV